MQLSYVKPFYKEEGWKWAALAFGPGLYICPAHNYKSMAVLNRLVGFWFEIVNIEIFFFVKNEFWNFYCVGCWSKLVRATRERGGGIMQKASHALNDRRVKWGWNLEAQACQQDILCCSIKFTVCSWGWRLGCWGKKLWIGIWGQRVIFGGKTHFFLGEFAPSNLLSAAIRNIWENCNAQKWQFGWWLFFFKLTSRFRNLACLFSGRFRKFRILCTSARGL